MTKLMKTLSWALMMVTIVLAATTPASAAQAGTAVVIDLNGPFTGPASAAGVATIDGVDATFAGSWQTNFDGNDIPRAVVGSYTITSSDGSLTVRFNAVLEGFQSPTELAFTERWAITDGSGSYANMRGSGTGTTIINLAAGPSLNVEMNVTLHP